MGKAQPAKLQHFTTDGTLRYRDYVFYFYFIFFLIRALHFSSKPQLRSAPAWTDSPSQTRCRGHRVARIAGVAGLWF
jgi:hypothetical protein